MKSKFPKIQFLSVVGVLALAAATLRAQSVATNLPSAGTLNSGVPGSAGLVNEALRQQNSLFDPFDLGGQFRARFVDQSYFAVPGAGPTVDFRANSPHSENDFLLLRTRIHLGYSPMDWIQVFGEGQNSSSTGDRRNPNLQSDGPLDLHQGYVRIGGGKDSPLSLKVGRQELSYGDERLIGAFDWDNIGRVFDAAKVRYEQNGFWVDGFAGRVVIPDDNNFDQANWNDWFSGVYASTRTLVPRTEFQLYFLADNACADSVRVAGTGGRGNSPRDIYTIGSRFQTLPGQWAGWDLNGEFAGQFGDFAYSAGTPAVVSGTRLDQLAYATHIEGGYTFDKAALKPRFGIGLDYASGDGNPKDNEHNTFVNLYPTNHKFYGAMDFVSWQNVIDPYLKATVSPTKGLSVALTYNAFWLATTSDFFYQANQSPRTTGGYGISPHLGSFAGQELDLIATYQLKPFLQFQGGFGHYFTGSYVDESLQNLGGSHDANWIYLQAQFAF